jgi:hypothetical protein
MSANVACAAGHENGGVGGGCLLSRHYANSG